MIMTHLRILFVILSLLATAISAIQELINGRLCERLICPPNCKLTFADGCPHNCNCGKLPSCPKLTKSDCPRPFPNCVILTQLDGCQVCACQEPVIATNPGDRNSLVWAKPPPDPTEPRGALASNLENTFETGPPPDLSALLPPGQKFDPNRPPQIFPLSTNLPRPTNSPTTTTTTATTTTTTTTTTTARITRPPLPAVVPVQRTQAPPPSPTQAPIVSIPRPVPSARISVEPPISSGKCTSEYQAVLDQKFDNLYRRIQWNLPRATIAFPVAFTFVRPDLFNVCNEYWTAIDSTSATAIDACLNSFEKLKTVYEKFHFVCSPGRQGIFLSYYDCLQDSNKAAEVRKCEGQQQSRDQSVNCEAFEILDGCVRDAVEEACGYDGWELYVQFLKDNIPSDQARCQQRNSARFAHRK